MSNSLTSNKSIQVLLSDLTLQLSQLNREFSFSRAFVRGILAGLGSAIGATMILGIIIYLLGALRFVPWVGESINSYVIEMTRNIPSR